MGYYIKKLERKNRVWKLMCQSSIGGKTRGWTVSNEDFKNLGFSNLMTLEEARSYCSSVNSKNSLKMMVERKRGIQDRIELEDKSLNANFPTSIMEEFQNLYLPKDHRKLESHWRCAKRLLAELNLEPKDWSYHRALFYKKFEENDYSYSYCQKLLSIINLWGRFLSRKQSLYFDPIPAPTNHTKEKIVDNHVEKRGQFTSDPIWPSMLLKNRSNLKIEHYNWIHLSIWLGLRPGEVDRLSLDSSRIPKDKSWYLDNDILWVYQSKLTGVGAKDRFKPIPLLYNDQKECVAIILSKTFKRPLVKSLKKYFSENTTTYGGRKGFVDLMLDKGHTIEAISQWLGHRNIDITWKIYKSKEKVLR